MGKKISNIVDLFSLRKDLNVEIEFITHNPKVPDKFKSIVHTYRKYESQYKGNLIILDDYRALLPTK